MAHRPAFTLLEVIMSSMVVALVLVGAMNASTSARAISADAADRATAAILADDLAGEIAAAPIDDAALVLVTTPAGVAAGLLRTVLGPLVDVTRSDFPSVDYYNEWTATPPEDIDGNPIPGLDTAWTRSVTVALVDQNGEATQAQGSEVGRLITVTVSRRGEPLAEVTLIRTHAGDRLWRP